MASLKHTIPFGFTHSLKHKQKKLCAQQKQMARSVLVFGAEAWACTQPQTQTKKCEVKKPRICFCWVEDGTRMAKPSPREVPQSRLSGAEKHDRGNPQKKPLRSTKADGTKCFGVWGRGVGLHTASDTNKKMRG